MAAAPNSDPGTTFLRLESVPPSYGTLYVPHIWESTVVGDLHLEDSNIRSKYVISEDASHHAESIGTI
jgi:hypothetical protein